MPPALLIPLVTEVGIPLATKLLALYESKTNVTSDMWIALLKEVSDNTPQTQMIAALRAINIAPESAEGQKFLGLVSGI